MDAARQTGEKVSLRSDRVQPFFFAENGFFVAEFSPMTGVFSIPSTGTYSDSRSRIFMRHIFVCLAAAILFCLGQPSRAAGVSDFALRVVAFDHLGGSPYGDPQSVLGKPTTWIAEVGNAVPVACSLVYGAWNVAPDGSPLIVTLGNAQQAGHLMVEFDPPLTHDANHWYGKDLIVFGNAFWSANALVNGASDMNAVRIVGASVFAEPVTVSVSPDGVQWFTYSTPTADGYFPTQAFVWNAAQHTWGQEQDWTKPVNPAVTPSQFAGKTAADAIALYDGSAGGTAFDLSLSGFATVRYVRMEGRGGEVDALSRVGYSTTTLTGTLTLQGLAASALPQTVTLTLTPAFGEPLTRTVTVDSSGTFTLPNIPRRALTVRAKGDKWLAAQTVIAPINQEFAPMALSLPVGDANNDNMVDIADLLLLIAHYNQAAPSADYLEAADFSADGITDITDLLLLIGNYNQTGD